MIYQHRGLPTEIIAGVKILTDRRHPLINWRGNFDARLISRTKSDKTHSAFMRRALGAS